MPRTRAAGPPEGGYQQLPTPKRKPRIQKSQTSLKMPTAVKTPRKRLHEDHDDDTADERSMKRVNTEPRARSTFLFDPAHGRSQLTPGRKNASISRNRRIAASQSARKPYRAENPFAARALDVQASIAKPQEPEKPEEETSQPVIDTPTKSQGIVGRLFGSIRKTIFGGSTDSPGFTRGSESPTPQQNPFEAAPIAPRRAAQISRLARLARQSSETTTDDVASSTAKQPTVEGSENSPPEDDHELQTTQVTGTNKRKLDTATEDRPPKKVMLNADENGRVTGSYGITDAELEISSDEEDDEENNGQSVQYPRLPVEEPPTKTPTGTGLDNFEPSFSRRGQFLSGQKLRSAMKSKPNPGKKVGFSSSLTSTKEVWPDFGPAGQYNGSLFTYTGPYTPEDDNAFSNTSAISLDTQSTTTPSQIDQEGTYNNTYRNKITNQLNLGGDKPWWDRTPGTETPSHQVITNPDGHFSVPDGDDTPTQEELSQPATVPSAPKIPHASLPDADERLHKARQEAQQYKPKQSSRLSNVEPARSRSSSPSNTLTSGILDDGRQQMQEAYEQTEEEIEKMREAEEWAASLEWPKPQSYIEAGLCSPYIDQLLRDRWTKEDDQLTHEFWKKEFREVDEMMEAAKSVGKTLELMYEE
ncbi:uncharacterized protein HMPREF1541_08358 [Cyphellophora europaea CBS 101466]|uniref:Uncharacterized protein n=1 Tax=Cyphellophora europaea (strain CBS 101466) TaxID=1220924 RepID=W2RLM5_CYPE1|nr:uncharacterized protein HMPREF1541_08358 [Cyphellophora europaea CBS 101466]ETN37367.1 hypothetical protein HMPREF1541_08358 [Cyphellophora europaea CBS 101466]